MANPHLFCKHWRILVRDFANARGMVVRIQAALPIRIWGASRGGRGGRGGVFDLAMGVGEGQDHDRCILGEAFWGNPFSAGQVSCRKQHRCSCILPSQ